MQIKVSKGVEYITEPMKRKYGLTDYTDKNLPCVFAGFYYTSDFEDIKNHKGQKIALWCGSDAKNCRAEYLKGAKNIAMSRCVQNTLLKKGIVSEVHNVTPTESFFAPTKRGSKIYMYTDGTAKYGSHLDLRLPFEVMQAHKGTYSKAQLFDVYRDCFINLRLTTHDGLPNTNLEMGMLGRRSIFNGDIPHSIPWRTIDDIREAVMKEYEREDDTEKVAKDISEYIKTDYSWMQ